MRWMKEREKQQYNIKQNNTIHKTIKPLKLSEKTINNYQTRTCTYRIYQNGNNLCNFRLEQTRKKTARKIKSNVARFKQNTIRFLIIALSYPKQIKT